MSRLGSVVAGLPWAAPPLVPQPIPVGGVAVEADSVTIELAGRVVVRAVDLRAGAGEVVALVGPNGAGKSTLLHALTGDLDPTSGEVRLAGRAVREWPPVALALRRGVLPQQHGVSFPFTVEQVVRMGRAPWAGTPEADQDEEVVAEAMAAVDVARLADRPVSHLSGGERARAGLARVLAQQTQVLFLDEPTAALDLHHQEVILRAVSVRTSRGATAVIVLHDLGQAAAWADRVVVLDEGGVAAEGPPAEVLEAGLLSEVYRHPIEVVTHPRTGDLLVLPRRG